MGTLSSDVPELLLAYDPDFVELETAPLLLDDMSFQGAVPAVLGGADESFPLDEEPCPEGRYEDFIANLRTFLREKKIEGGVDWDAVVISGPELFSMRPGPRDRDRIEADEETMDPQQTSGAEETLGGAYQNEFDSDEDEDEDDEFFARLPTRDQKTFRSEGGVWGAAESEARMPESSELRGSNIGDLIVELPSPGADEEIVGAMDETEAEASRETSSAEASRETSSAEASRETSSAEPHKNEADVAWDIVVAEDPGWGSAPTYNSMVPAQDASLLQYIVPTASFAEGSLSLPE